MLIIRLLIVLEMLCVNIASVERFCRRKYRRSVNFLVLAAFSLLFFGSILLLFPQYGNGKLMILGLLYLIPLSLLYENSIFRMFIIMCMNWAYSLFAFVSAYQISRLLGEENLYVNMLLIQTGIYAVTLYPLFKWAIPKFIFILENLGNYNRECVRYFNLNCILQSATIVILNVVFLAEAGSPAKILAICFFFGTTILSYVMIYHIVSDSVRIRKLEQVSLRDDLTGLANRVCLFEDLQELRRGKAVFSILFMDFDRFKEVNDTYGHVVGDQYLRHFADICGDVFRGSGKAYRFGGDEFVVLCPGDIPEDKIEELQACRSWEQGAPCPFNQVSIGAIACRPPFEDADFLMHEVDQKMYEMKLKSREALLGVTGSGRTFANEKGSAI